MLERVLFGSGVTEKLNEIIGTIKAQKVFLISGKASFNSLVNKKIILDALKGKDVCQYTDFDVNPNSEDIIKGTGILTGFSPDVILAVGGGSVIDTAKLLSVMPADRNSIIESIQNGIVNSDRKIPLVVIPTTAGSGSESTHFAVVYIGNEKFSLADKRLLPDFALIDPVSTYSMPSRLTAITAMDALSQAVESFWAVGGTDESRAYAAESIQLNLKAYKQVVLAPDAPSREVMMRAAYLAGKAINISKTTAPHAFSYYLTKKFNIPHGQAVGMLLPIFMYYNATHDKVKGDVNQHKIRMQELQKLFGATSINQAVEKVREMLVLGGINLTFNDFGMNTPTHFEDFMSNVNYERLGNNPVEVEREVVMKCI